MKKTVAFIIGHLSHGGAEKQLYLLTKGLDKNEFTPLVICLSKTSHPWGDRIMKSGTKVIYISRLFRYDITRVLRLIWYLYYYNPHIIVSSLHIANVYCWLARKIYFRKSTYIAQVRSKESQMKNIQKYLNIYAFKSAKLIITNSNILPVYYTWLNAITN